MERKRNDQIQKKKTSEWKRKMARMNLRRARAMTSLSDPLL